MEECKSEGSGWDTRSEKERQRDSGRDRRTGREREAKRDSGRDKERQRKRERNDRNEINVRVCEKNQISEINCQLGDPCS